MKLKVAHKVELGDAEKVETGEIQLSDKSSSKSETNFEKWVAKAGEAVKTNSIILEKD